MLLTQNCHQSHVYIYTNTTQVDPYTKTFSVTVKSFPSSCELQLVPLKFIFYYSKQQQKNKKQSKL